MSEYRTTQEVNSEVFLRIQIMDPENPITGPLVPWEEWGGDPLRMLFPVEIDGEKCTVEIFLNCSPSEKGIYAGAFEEVLANFLITEKDQLPAWVQALKVFSIETRTNCLKHCGWKDHQPHDDLLQVHVSWKGLVLNDQVALEECDTGFVPYRGTAAKIVARLRKHWYEYELLELPADPNDPTCRCEPDPEEKNECSDSVSPTG